ncbi:glycosyltransferase family 4 protein [Maribacter sp. 2307ULW6-5]|uniref:glycosyltransferase family 4 protein n=1 Tax=Maribacter sp. 2307ULW6-5 TaxID=3386275 RepID=UPI0039BC3097
MKILFLTDNFIPETNAPAYRTYKHAREWVKQGVEVTVITCAPNFPYGKVYDGYKNKLFQIEMVEGIKVIRVWSYMAENKGFLKRILDFCSFMVSAFVAGLFVKTDIIVATSPQFFTAICGRWLAFWKRKKWVMEVRDLWPESLKGVGVMKDNLIIRFFESVEHDLYKSAWKIVPVTHSMGQTIQNKHNIPSEKIKVIRNGVDFKEFYPLPKNKELISELNLEGKIVIGYLGTHGMAHGLDFILRAASKLKTNRIHFLFIGSGAEKNNLLMLNETLRLKNTSFLSPVSKTDVKKYISIFDYGLVNLIDSSVFEGVLPSKMNELIAMKKPILLGVKGEAQEFIRNYNLGLCYLPENEQDFLSAVELINEKPKHLKVDLDAGVKDIIDLERLAQNMLDFLKK